MTIEDLREKQLIVFECISGSKAYGLDTPSSDTDIKGIFVLPRRNFYSLQYVPQVSNASNDIVFYELGRFFELISINNPNILELLNTPKDAVIYRHPFLSVLDPALFLSALCKDTFGKFALSQIKKAKGLNKKIANPIDQERKNILHFCYISYEKGALPLLTFLEKKGWKQENCGLTNIPHMKNIYGLYYNENANYNGIVKKDIANEVILSSIPESAKQEALLYFNKDGYTAYCKEYKLYWEWVKARNESRYENTMAHGKNYDAKNMMHTFRLLNMAIEIGKTGEVNVKRPDHEFLLKVKSGAFAYEELLTLAEEKQQKIEEVYKNTALPPKPDIMKINELLNQLRLTFYSVATFQ